MANDLPHRLAVLETAVERALNLRLSEFDPDSAVAARKQALAQARADAVALIGDAVDKAIVELSVEDRFARLERAVTQGSGVSLDG